jgi:ribosomal protein RSM22 (predicted rRNA methylase)
MTWRVPTDLEDAVRHAAINAVGAGLLGDAALAAAVVDRSRRYTSARELLAQPSNPRADLAARAAFFTLADALKPAVALAELRGRGALPSGRPLRVVDVGAGCGAMSLGVVLAVGAASLHLIDHDGAALKIARAAIEGFARSRAVAVTVTTAGGDVATAAVPPADLIVMGSVLNELAPAAALAVVERALASLAPDGALIIIEPALRETARGLHAIRDAVLGRGLAAVFAPCTRTIAPCPMLADERDWCHEERPLELPPRAAAVSRLTGLRDGGMKFAYLVLRPPTAAGTVGPGTPDALRVVSHPAAEKGKVSLYGCGADGRVELRLLRRNRSEANRGFERAGRGDVLVLADEAPTVDARREITASTEVVRYQPAG